MLRGFGGRFWYIEGLDVTPFPMWTLSCWQHSCYSFTLSDFYEQKTYHTCTNIGTNCVFSKPRYSNPWKIENIQYFDEHNLVSFCFYFIYQLIAYERNSKDPILLTYWYLLKEILDQHWFEPKFNRTCYEAEMKLQSYVLIVIRDMWYVYEPWVIYTSPTLLIIHLTCMHHMSMLWLEEYIW